MLLLSLSVLPGLGLCLLKATTNPPLALVAHLVGASSSTLKDCKFNPQSGHIREQPLDVSHINLSLSIALFPTPKLIIIKRKTYSF